jgi:hypothetical protein
MALVFFWPIIGTAAPKLDPIKFTLSTTSSQIELNKQFEITISAEYRSIPSNTVFVLEGSNSFKLKLVLPDGFQQVGGSYHDYIGTELSYKNPKVSYTLKGKFTSASSNGIFQLLRSHKNADRQSTFIEAGRLSFQVVAGSDHSAASRNAVVVIDTVGFVPYMSIAALRLSGADNANVVQIVDGYKSGMFRYVASDKTSPDDSVMVIRHDTLRYHRIYEGLVNVRWYGAMGDSSTDDTQALKTAMSKNPTGVYFPKGTYLISSSIKFYSPIQGAGNYRTSIKASANFSDTLMIMIDCNAGQERKAIRDICLDASNKPGVQHLGSSKNGEGSSGSLYENVYFYDSHKDVFSIDASSNIPGPGMLTGATFLNCHFRGIGKAVSIGINQDDVQFIGCRFGLDESTLDTPFVVGSGSNHRFQGCYFYIQNVGVSNSVGKIFQVGNNLVTFENNFIESPVSTNITHLFHCASPNSNLVVNGLHLNLNGASSFVALIRAQIESTSHDFRTVRIENVGKSTNFPANAKLLDVYVAVTTPKLISLYFTGVDFFSDVYQFASSGSVNSNNILRLEGTFKGLSYSNFANTSGIRENSGNSVVKSEGLVSDFITSQTPTGASPQSTNFTLPRYGQYLVSVTAKIDGYRDHMLTATYIINFWSGVNNILVTELLGSVKKSVGSTWGLNNLTVSNPDSVGQVTVSASWTTGGSRSVSFVINSRKINTY